MKLFNSLRKIRRRFSRFRPLVEVLISQDRLLNNLGELQKQYPRLSFAPVLKSNAYGHGLVETAEILDKEKIAFLAVDSLSEAMTLRQHGFKSEILVIGYTWPENIKNFPLPNLTFTIISLEQLVAVAELVKRPVRLHLKIDTGMGRQGILLEQVDEAIRVIKENQQLILEGVCSHLADADSSDESFTGAQIKAWQQAAVRFKNSFSDIKYFHFSATAGLAYSSAADNNVVRLGLGLYGINPSPRLNFNLKPVLKLRSVISSVKHLPAGASVGYGATYKLPHAATIATVPAGYFEGVDRRLSNCGFFKVQGQACPIVGRVSMNITTIDVSAVKNVKVGEEVVIISDNGADKNSVENIAKITGTIPWEILVHLPVHLRRKVV